MCAVSVDSALRSFFKAHIPGLLVNFRRAPTFGSYPRVCNDIAKPRCGARHGVQ